MTKINGNNVPLTGKSLLTYLEEEGYSTDKIAVEINQKIVPKSQYSSTYFSGEDQVEIVCFVGGG